MPCLKISSDCVSQQMKSAIKDLEFSIDKDEIHILNPGACLTDTIDFKIQEDDTWTEDQIDNHPMMIEAKDKYEEFQDNYILVSDNNIIDFRLLNIEK